MKRLFAFLLIMPFVSPAAAQTKKKAVSEKSDTCSLKLNQSPIFRDSLRLGADISDVYKNFPLEPDKSQKSNTRKFGTIDMVDVIYKVTFYNDKLEKIEATYPNSVEDSTKEFAELLATKFGLLSKWRVKYDAEDIEAFQAINAQIADLTAKKEELRARYADNHALVQQVEAQIETQRKMYKARLNRTFSLTCTDFSIKVLSVNSYVVTNLTLQREFEEAEQRRRVKEKAKVFNP